MEHVQKLLHRVRHRESTDDRPRNPLYIASLSFVFALTSVSLHEAMSAFVYDEGVAAGVKLATAWAIVPFAVTLAWESVRCRFLAIPMGIVAVLSTFFAGWLFSWSLHTIIIDPKDPSLVLLAAQGNIHTFTHSRGVFRSTDGGQSWKQTA